MTKIRGTAGSGILHKFDEIGSSIASTRAFVQVSETSPVFHTLVAQTRSQSDEGNGYRNIDPLSTPSGDSLSVRNAVQRRHQSNWQNNRLPSSSAGVVWEVERSSQRNVPVKDVEDNPDFSPIPNFVLA